MFEGVKRLVKATPVLGPLAVRWAALRRRRRGEAAFAGSAGYWERRYATGGTSGHGSYGRLAEFKAEVLNRFVAEERIGTVIEFGCGDGNQLSLAAYPDYVGLDVSESALGACRRRFANDPGKRFLPYRPGGRDGGAPLSADLALSLDVIYHLTEDEVFEAYMCDLFDAARKFVVIYSSDTAVTDPAEPPHVKHREFSRWVAGRRPEWRLIRRVPNRFPAGGDDAPGSFAEFFIFARERPAG
jgi:hypothetical protein